MGLVRTDESAFDKLGHIGMILGELFKGTVPSPVNTTISHMGDMEMFLKNNAYGQGGTTLKPAQHMVGILHNPTVNSNNLIGNPVLKRFLRSTRGNTFKNNG